MGFPFSDHIALLEQFLKGRPAIVGGLERQVFSARGKAHAASGDRESVGDILDACFFESPTISRHLSGLKGQLDAAHLADGFEPARQDGYSRALDPVELVLRACHHWDGTRWPGTNGRLAYAQTLYAVVMLRQLEHLSVRIWDEDRPSSIVHRPSSSSEQAAERLQHVQGLLDVLNAGEIRLVRDARWLIQTAQGALTRHVKPYFIKAANISGSFTDTDRLEIHKAGAVLAGGHLRSQLRHLSRRTAWPFDDPQLLALTRSSNSMDMALLVRDLVPLLDAYSAACMRQDGDARLALADAILQGLSADPELLLTRLDLLGPSTMLEELFIERGDTHAARQAGPIEVGRNFSCATYSSLGDVHREYLARYGELVARTAESLLQDSRALDPAGAAYSPLGIVYGFCADLFSNMVLNTLRSPSPPDLSLEDVFLSRGRLEEKQTQAREWERLPKGEGERAPFEHSPEWATQMYARLAGALEARAARPTEPNASQFSTACLYVVPRGVAIESLPDVAQGSRSVAQGSHPVAQGSHSVAQGFSPVVSAQEHCLTSDVARAGTTGATSLTADRISADRAEGRWLASARAEGVWFGVSKVLLTIFTSQGKDALITDVPPGVIDVLRVVCPELLVTIGTPP